MTSLLGLVAPDSVTLYWYVVRGSGFVVYVLLTVALVLGLLLSLRWRTDRWPRLLTEELHQFLQLVAGVFLAIHIASTLLDSFVHFQLYEVLVPFTDQYRTFWLSLGIIAMYLGISLALSVYLRPFMGYRAWRTLHYAGFLAWLAALAHSIATGTDTKAPWAITIYLTSAVVIVSLLCVRFGGVPVRLGNPPRLRPYVLAGLCFALLLGGMLTASGPLQRGWAARVGAVPGPSIATVFLPSPFRASLSGIAHPYTRYILDPGFQMLTLDLTGQGPYPLVVAFRMLVNESKYGLRFVRGLFSLAPNSGSWNCSGTASFRPPDQLMGTCRLSSTETLWVIARVHLDLLGRVQGSMVVTPLRRAGRGGNLSLKARTSRVPRE